MAVFTVLFTASHLTLLLCVWHWQRRRGPPFHWQVTQAATGTASGSGNFTQAQLSTLALAVRVGSLVNHFTQFSGRFKAQRTTVTGKRDPHTQLPRLCQLVHRGSSELCGTSLKYFTEMLRLCGSTARISALMRFPLRMAPGQRFVGDVNPFETLYRDCKQSSADYKAFFEHYKALSEKRIADLSKHVHLLHSLLTARRHFEDIARLMPTPVGRSLSTTDASRIAATHPDFMRYLVKVGAAVSFTPNQLSTAACETYKNLSNCIHDSVALTFPIEKLDCRVFTSREAAISACAMFRFYNRGGHLVFIDFDGSELSIPSPESGDNEPVSKALPPAAAAGASGPGGL